MNYYRFLVDSRFLLRMSEELMKDWVYFYIEHTIKYGEPFFKESGWSLGLQNSYIVMSMTRS
ncbi:TPA: hypothetical protein ACSIN5_001020 [Acinetobacter baumannii]|uniref:hypothetical protein n=1 Tax=Acinetobacter baumannii TaxID=470 RepID=UPI000C701770|nr:hypothetical protein [Acinetobacter baumannii]MCG9257346.1 hypothetical protein [Acinetobacter baumannii]MCG9260674.1 hypothetical protein [Acinetobacter baumannii]MPU14232.1 hypothetical protein [Acinetobacter baumannii]PQL68965.1 hypothetical protein CV956_007980 [Acinetobacter baumannii]PQL87760.1 hypothetical protein CV955_0008830 [Acinetobacter baumannii]